MSYMRLGASAAVAVPVSAITTFGVYAGSATNAAFGEIRTAGVPNCSGLYELQLPNNGLAVGARAATFFLTDAGNSESWVVSPLEFQLVAEDPGTHTWDVVRASRATAGTFGEGAASVQGNVTGSVASVTGAVGSVTGAVGSVTGAVGSVTAAVTVGELTTTARAEIKTDAVIAAFTTDTYAELAAVPAATSPIFTMLRWLFVLARNKRTATATAEALRNDADAGDIATNAHSDDGVTSVRGEWT